MRCSSVAVAGIACAALGVFLTWLQTGSAQSMSGRPVTDPLKLGKIQLLPGSDFEFISPTGVELWSLTTTGANAFLRGGFFGNQWVPVSTTAGVFGNEVVHGNLRVLGHTSSANVSAVSATFGTITIGACHGAGCGGGGGGVTDPLTVNGWTPASGTATITGSLVRNATLTPATITTNLVLWLEADAGVFSDTGCSAVITSGGLANCWADQSGTGEQFKASTGAERPSWWAHQRHGRPGMHFGMFDPDSSTDMTLGSNSALALQTFTTCVVADTTKSQNTLSSFAVFDGSANGWLMGLGATPANDTYRFYNVASGSFNGEGAIRPSIVSVECVIFDQPGNDQEVWVDGAQTFTTTVPSTITYTSAVPRVGAAAGGVQNWVGDIYEVVEYQTHVNGTGMNKLFTYFRQKWGEGDEP